MVAAAYPATATAAILRYPGCRLRSCRSQALGSYYWTDADSQGEQAKKKIEVICACVEGGAREPIPACKIEPLVNPPTLNITESECRTPVVQTCCLIVQLSKQHSRAMSTASRRLSQESAFFRILDLPNAISTSPRSLVVQYAFRAA